MKYHDITRELLSAPLYPGDPLPVVEPVSEMDKGAPYNLSILTASLHSGTHCDAYLHFSAGNKDIAEMPLDHFIGPCYVLSVPENCLVKANFLKKHLPRDVKRLLLKSHGTSYLAPSAGKYLMGQGIITVGTDAWSVAPSEDEGSVHIPFLTNNIAIIESLDLDGVSDGAYFLIAAPLKIKGAEAGQCRALLFEGCPRKNTRREETLA